MPTGQQYSSVSVQAQLTAGISNANTTCTVNSTSGFPSTPFTIVFDIGTASQEICDVTNVAGLTLTITRGVDGSAAQSHSNGATVTHSVIARDEREARAHIDASMSNDATGKSVHGLAVGSSVVGTTDTQTITNKTLTSPTITGPSITGTVSGGATYTSPTLQNATATGSSASTVPLTVKGAASQTADLLDVTDNVPNTLFKVTSNGATGAGAAVFSPTDTGHVPLTINAPGAGVDLADFQVSGSTKIALGATGQVTGITIQANGSTGATTVSRYAGGTTGGPPTTGTFSTGDWVSDTVNGIIWTCVSGGTPGTWRASGKALIAAPQILGSSASSVTFSSIPQYFNHLEVLVIAKTNSSTAAGYDNLQLQINGVSGGQYDSLQEFETQGSNAVTGFTSSASTASIVGSVWGNHFATQGAGYTEISMPYYSTTTFGKSWNARSIASDGGTVGIKQTLAGSFNTANSTAAITSITLSPSTASFVSGSAFFLYGVE